jgi:transforming growth factor-beta-induced protein
MGDVYANQAPVSDFDLTAENGVVHILDAVVLPSQTVADIAIGSAVHTSLVAAVIKAELLPALTNPLASLTVFAPTNQAFDALATALGTDLNGVLANPELADILLYHVVNGTVLSTDLANGLVPTLNGQSVLVDLTTGVMINQSNVTAEDNVADNGVVHIIDAVLVPSLAGIEESQIEILSVYPNPASNVLNINNSLKGNYELVSIYGEVVKSGTLSNNAIDVSELSTGNYFIKLTNNTTVYQAKFIKL